MKVAACDPYVAAGDPAWQGTARHENLQGLLEACDLLSLHVPLADGTRNLIRSEEHTSELQSLMRISYAVFCLKKKKITTKSKTTSTKSRRQQYTPPNPDKQAYKKTNTRHDRKEPST